MVLLVVFAKAYLSNQQCGECFHLARNGEVVLQACNATYVAACDPAYNLCEIPAVLDMIIAATTGCDLRCLLDDVILQSIGTVELDAFCHVDGSHVCRDTNLACDETGQCNSVCSTAFDSICNAGTGCPYPSILTNEIDCSTSNIILNPGFESPDVPVADAHLRVEEPDLTDWSITDGNVDVISTTYDQFEGDQCLELAGGVYATIEQTVTLVGPANYTLEFYHSGHPNIRGTESSERRFTLTVSDGSTDLLTDSFLTDANDIGKTSMNYQYATYDIPAAAGSNPYTIEFQATCCDNRRGSVLDAVSLCNQQYTASVVAPPAGSLDDGAYGQDSCYIYQEKSCGVNVDDVDVRVTSLGMYAHDESGTSTFVGGTEFESWLLVCDSSASGGGYSVSVCFGTVDILGLIFDSTTNLYAATDSVFGVPGVTYNIDRSLSDASLDWLDSNSFTIAGQTGSDGTDAIRILTECFE